MIRDVPLQTLETIFRDIPAALAVLKGPEFIFEMANEDYCRLVGRDNIVGKSLEEALPEIVDQPFPAILTKVLETGETFQAREVEAFLQSRQVFVDLTYRRILDVEQKPYGIFVFAVDVTEKVVSRSRIQLERVKLEAVFANASAALAIVRGPDAIFEKANESYLNLFDRRKLIGKPLLEALPELKDQKFPDLILHVLNTGEPYIENEARAELRRSEHGELEVRYFDQSYSRILDEQRKPYGVLIQATDVTERVHSRRKLAESERQFRLMADVMPQVVWTAQPDGILDYTNEQWRQYSGSSDPGQWLTFVHPDDMPRAVQAWTQSVGSGERYEIEFRLRREDQSYRWFLVRAQPTCDSDGNIERWIGTCTDIQDQKTALAIRNDFMSIASHELKTPLTSLKLQTQSMRRNYSKGRPDSFSMEKVGALIANNEKQVDRLVRLVDDMLDLSQIESGKLSMVREETDLGELVKEVHSRLKEQLDAKGCESSLDQVPSAIGWFDRFRIEQVVTNLLTNAGRYGDRKPVRIRVVNLGDLARISVADQGRGIAPENRERIFNRFERAVSADEISGLGLGLYISREIVEAHRGRIWVESELGHGSEFHVELPLGERE
jgi:PAS domain S-box-containing protein